MRYLIASLFLGSVVSPILADSSRPVDAYGGALAIRGEQTGWFDVQSIGGRDFFITPDGHAFFSLGVTHSVECMERDELGLFESRYGGDEAKLSEFFLRKFSQWGFNSSGYGPLPTMVQRIPYVATIETIGPRSLSAGANSKSHDLFDPAVLERLRQRVRKDCQPHVDNRFCLGYVFIDLPIWSIQWQGQGDQATYLDFLKSLPSSASGKQAYLRIFPDQDHADNPEAAETFINEIADRYYACISEELRKHDSHHLILGDRLMAFPNRTPDSILVTASKYVDVISFQPMGTRMPLRQYIDHVHQITGKPVVLADVNTMTRRPEKEEEDVEEYQRGAGEHTLAFYLDAASSPHCIGLHRCTVRDYQPWNVKYHRRGLMKADDSEYPILVRYTQRTNGRVYDLVYGKAASQTENGNAGDGDAGKGEVLQVQPLADLGMIDVTAPPFLADPTGETDSTEALQRAVRYSRDAQMATFFPAGTYTISDTLECLHGRWDPDVGQLRQTRDLPCILIGDRSSEQRPVIRLADNSPGFNNPKSPKHVVRFWAYGSGVEQARTELQPNMNMNQMLIGIDVTVGNGNPGAVGIRHRAAQGSSIQDCTIDARGGLTGLEGGAGSGGSHFGVTVIGGKIGVDYRETQPAPTIVGFTLIDQEETAIINASRQALTMVGCHIETKTAGPVIVSEQTTAHHGQISMVDSVIDFKTPGNNTAIDAGAAITLHNVCVHNARTIVRHGDEALLKGADAGWTRVEELAAAIAPPPLGSWTTMPGLQFEASIYLDGKPIASPSIATSSRVKEPPVGFGQSHLWDSSFPSWQSPGAVNVCKPPYSAKGNGNSDDTEAIQRAVDEHEIVFFPKGIYRISKPIQLRPSTKLIGVGRCFSWIEPTGGEGSAFADATHPQPLIQTADDATAETVLAFLGLRVRLEAPGAYCLDWQCGPRSIYRAVNVEMAGHWLAKRLKNPVVYDFPLVRISGNGGGRFYNFHQESWSLHGPNYRHLLVEGTRQPLHLYQCNPEHARSEANMEIRDAKNVSVYGVKGEYQNPIIRIVDSDQIRIFGYGGIAAAWPGKALFVIENTPNYVITNLVDTPRLEGKGTPEHFAGIGVDPRKWHMFRDTPGESNSTLSRPLDRPVLVRRGQFRAP